MSLYQEYIPEARGRVFGASTPSLVLSGHEDSFPPWPCIQLSGLGQSLSTQSCLLRTTPQARLVGVYSGREGGRWRCLGLSRGGSAGTVGNLHC